MKQLKDWIISAAILFSVILAGVCVVWWGYASQYHEILGTSPSSPMLQKPSSVLVFAVLTAGLTAGIFVFLFRKKLPFFKNIVVKTKKRITADHRQLGCNKSPIELFNIFETQGN